MISDPNENYEYPSHIKKRLAELDDLARSSNWQQIQDHFAEDYDLEQKKGYWASRSDATASDAAIKDAKLEPIQKRLNELAAEREVMRGDDNTSNQKKRSSSVKESMKAREERLLKEFEAEVKASGEYGAVARVHARELTKNPKADRSYIGKQIKKARDAATESKQGAKIFGTLVRSGKREN